MPGGLSRRQFQHGIGEVEAGVLIAAIDQGNGGSSSASEIQEPGIFDPFQRLSQNLPMTTRIGLMDPGANETVLYDFIEKHEGPELLEPPSIFSGELLRKGTADAAPVGRRK